MSELDPMTRLDRLADAVDEALRQRDLPAYRIAQTAYGACLDQLHAKVAARETAEARSGIVLLELWLRLQ